MWVNDNNDTISGNLGPLTTRQWVFKWSLSVTPRPLLSLSLLCVHQKKPKGKKNKKKQKRAAKLVYQLHERKIFRKWRQNQSPKISNNQHWLVDDGWWHMNEEGNWAIRRQLTRVQQQIHTHKKTTRPIHYANTGHNKLSCTTFTQPNKSHYPAVAFQSSVMKISNEEKKERKKENKRINCVNVLKECGTPPIIQKKERRRRRDRREFGALDAPC